MTTTLFDLLGPMKNNFPLSVTKLAKNVFSHTAGASWSVDLILRPLLLVNCF